ncbi:MAG: hypothetical protein K5930_04590 [Treponemataceae bacterium]|nr:hypothetical protein [Treponemataceae bacterium]
MRKKSFLSITLLFLSFSLFAESLYTLSTEHFDLIYPEACQETALILYENVEALYKKATDLLQSDEELFIPVYITPDNQQLNAYYTPFPYNRIVFYDTPVDSFSMAVFSETKLSVFYHELVHAVSMNIRDGFWSFLSSFLGDCYSPSYLFTSTLSFLEGVTVSFESMDGEGRLNNGDHMAFLVQAKLENKFPSWKDASGPRDIFPSSYYAYLFGGAFNRYIQNKYGMDKYAEFWAKCGNPSFFKPFVDDSFEAVYGIPLEDEWKLFEESIPLPVISADTEVKSLSSEPSLSSCLAFRNGKEKGLAFLDNASYIKYLPLDPVTGLPGQERKLLLADGGISKLSFSNDGRYLLINGIGKNLSKSYSLKVYDMDTETYVSQELYPLSSSCLAEIPDYGAFVIGVAVRSGRACLEIRDFEGVKAFGNSADVLYSEQLPIDLEIYNILSAGDNIFSLEKQHGKWQLSVYELCVGNNSYSLEKRGDYAFPQGIVPSSFAFAGEDRDNLIFYSAVAGEGLLSGSETSPGALSRLLVMECPSHGEGPLRLSLGREDVSGGVHNPFYFSQADKLYFIARKSESMDLSFCDGIPGGVSEIALMEMNVCADASRVEAGETYMTQASSPSMPASEPPEREKYNAFEYLFSGPVLPVGMDLTSEYPYELGATWMLMDPTERVKLLLSGGWNYIEKNGGISLRSWGGPSFLSYDLSFLADWNASGLAKIKDKCILSGVIPVYTLRQELQYSDTFTHEFSMDSSMLIENSIDLSYSAVYKTGKKVYDKWFVLSGVRFVTEYESLPDSPSSFFNNLGFYLSAGVGGFIPLSAKADLIKNSEEFLSLSADAVLYSAEIQKGIPFFPFYANRFTFTAGYEADWKTSAQNMLILELPALITNLSDLNIKHGLKCGANFTLSPIVSLTYSFQFELGADFIWYFANEQSDKLYDLVLCGVFTF